MSEEAKAPAFILHVTYRVAPSDAAAFLDHLRPAWEGVVREPENLFFEVTQDPQQPGVFRFVEAWSRDVGWFMAHQVTKPYYGPYLEAIGPLLIEERKVEVHERVPGFTAVKEGFVRDAVVKP